MKKSISCDLRWQRDRHPQVVAVPCQRGNRSAVLPITTFSAMWLIAICSACAIKNWQIENSCIDRLGSKQLVVKFPSQARRAFVHFLDVETSN